MLQWGHACQATNEMLSTPHLITLVTLPKMKPRNPSAQHFSPSLSSMILISNNNLQSFRSLHEFFLSLQRFYCFCYAVPKFSPVEIRVFGDHPTPPNLVFQVAPFLVKASFFFVLFPPSPAGASDGIISLWLCCGRSG